MSFLYALLICHSYMSFLYVLLICPSYMSFLSVLESDLINFHVLLMCPSYVSFLYVLYMSFLTSPSPCYMIICLHCSTIPTLHIIYYYYYKWFLGILPHDKHNSLPRSHLQMFSEYLDVSRFNKIVSINNIKVFSECVRYVFRLCILD